MELFWISSACLLLASAATTPQPSQASLPPTARKQSLIVNSDVKPPNQTSRCSPASPHLSSQSSSQTSTCIPRHHAQPFSQPQHLRAREETRGHPSSRCSLSRSKQQPRDFCALLNDAQSLNVAAARIIFFFQTPDSATEMFLSRFQQS